MRCNVWKRAVSILLAALLAFSAVPVTAPAAEGSEGKLREIAGECTITVPSSEGARTPDQMVDGRQDTLWVNNGAEWPCTVEFMLPADNTKCVKKVVLKFENHANRSMDIALQYALNGVTSDLIAVDGSEKTAVLSEGYEYVFDTPQAMSHLYVTLTNPLTDGLAGQFWPAIAEAEIYVDEGVQEEIELENLAVSKAVRISMEESVNASAGKGNAADGDFATSSPLHTKNFNEIAAADGTLPFLELELNADQKIRQFVVAMKEDASGAKFRFKIYGRSRWDAYFEEDVSGGKAGSFYQEAASGSIGTASGQNRVELSVDEPEYKYIRIEFTAENEAARTAIPQLAEFQVMANKASVVDADAENIAWGSRDLHANTGQDTVSRIVDGNTQNTWMASQYPAYVDIGLGGRYRLSEIEVYTPAAGYSQYSVYYSSDKVNYTKLAEKTGTASCPAEGEVYQANGAEAVSVRILLEYHSRNAQAVLNEVRIKGEEVRIEAAKAKDAGFEPPASYEESEYNVPVAAQDTIDEVKGIISRNIGEEYTDWFDFEIGSEDEYDYYEIEDTADGRIRITGNDGVSLASGLNYYLKYYCNASITQVGNQVNLPKRAVPVGQRVRKECKVPVRYAYNYCTMSYSMPFWGENEWRKELDWLALNGVNIVLDVTAQEEVWRQFLCALGYSHEEAKDYIAGPAYYAWAYMANLSGYGGPVHDSWFAKRTELARKNQLIMRKLGMQPILQGYSGMVPVDIAQKAQGEYALSGSDVIAQGNWCSFQRPYMLRTTSAAYQKYAALFYECQQNVFGDVTDYYATDPFHEGGNTGGMNAVDVSSNVLDAMIAHDENAVWVIQAWQGNPSAALVNGLAGRKEHALILDLYAEKDTHWNQSGYSGGREFQSTPWVYCMLNNFGGRMGLHGHMDNLVSGVVEAANTAEKMTGIGITPEGSQNNPVLYDLLFETVWCDDASQPLEKIDTEVWLKDYVTRRYGAESENAYQAMRILENTVYKASLNMNGQGAPESYVNARPATSIGAASTWGNAIISYNMADLEQAAELLLADYDLLKDSDGYQYDLADILKQILSNSSQSYHSRMVQALNAGDLERFTEASDDFLRLVDRVDQLLGTRKEFLLGTWVEQAKALAEGTDDFTKDLYEFNAKSLVTTWGAYPQAESGGLKDYSNRQWAGLTKDFYRERWSKWIAYQKERLAGNNPSAINWFEMEWAWARANTEYTTEASGLDLQMLGTGILKNYKSGTISDTAVDRVSISQEVTGLRVGEILWLDASVLPEEADNRMLSWESSDPEIAEVDADGLVTAKAKGTVTITASAKDGSGMDSIVLDIKGTAVKNIWLSAEKTELKVGEIAKINAAVLPEDAEDKSLSWLSSNPGAASVDGNGRVTAKSEGTVTITASARDGSGVSGSIVLTVTKQAVNPPQPPQPEQPQPQPPEQPKLPKKGEVVKTKAYEFRVTASTASKKTIAVTKLPDKKTKKLTVPDTVKISGQTYKVTEIAAKAFRNNTKLTQVVIGKNVQKIGKNAFEGCKNIKQVTVKSKALNSIGKNAFKGIKKNAKITVPKKKYKDYARLLKKAKTAKSVKIVKK